MAPPDGISNAPKKYYGGIPIYTSPRELAEGFARQEYTKKPADNRTPILLPDVFSPPREWDQSYPPHGQLTLFNLLTLDLDHDGEPDIDPGQIYAFELDAHEDAEASLKTLQRYLIDASLPHGIVNCSFSIAAFSAALPGISDHLPARLAHVAEDDFITPSLKPEERAALQNFFYSRAAYYASHPGAPAHQSTKTLFERAALFLDFLQRASQHGLFIFESVPNAAEACTASNSPEIKDLGAAWMSSSAIAVGAIRSWNRCPLDAIPLADIGAPEASIFDLKYLPEDHIKWENADSKLTIVTSLDEVPTEGTFLVSQPIWPKKILGEYFDRMVEVSFFEDEPLGPTPDYIFRDEPSGPTPGRIFTKGKGMALRYISGRGEDAHINEVSVVPASRTKNVDGNVYYLDKDGDRIPDRPSRIIFQGTSLATQHAVALASLVMQGKEGKTDPEAFKRDFVTALHELTEGKILPQTINSMVVKQMRERILGKE